MKKLLGAITVALLLFPAAADARHRSYTHHHATGYYTATSGHRVHGPVASSHRPAGATAHCRDGTWSFSESHRGTCSWHGGVAQWLR